MGKMKELWEEQNASGMAEAYDNSHLKSPQFTSEDAQQMSEDMKKQSAASKKAAKRGTFTPKNAKAPF